MKITHAVMALIALAAGLAVAEPGKPVALLDQVPYRDEGMGSRNPE
jgi:hypothetical protein